MRLRIAHTTTYHFEEPVPYGLQQLRLRPRSLPGQQVNAWSTRVDGGRVEVSFDDQFGNIVELVSLAPGATETTIVADGEVETTDTAGVLPLHPGYAPLWLFQRSTPRTVAGEAVADLTADMPASDDISGLHELAGRIREQVVYEHGRTDVATTAEEVLASGHGVCQDHAHVFLAAARRLGYPARYVSGYLLTDDVAQQDASHAWADAWVEGLGWVGFDVANGISPDDRYVRVATGLDYGDAAPITGVRFGAGEEVSPGRPARATVTAVPGVPR